MAEHKVVNVTQLDADLTSIANAIRNRAGTSAKIEFPTGFVNTIRSIPIGEGGDASAGLVVKSGSTTEQTFDTGLSSISYLVLFKKSNGATGLVEGFFSTDACTYVYCLSYSTTIKNFSMGSGVSKYSFDGGTFSLATTGTSGFSSGVTYYWYAFGTE